MKRWAFIAIACLNSFFALAQEDSLTQVEYDTVVVNQPTVVVNRRVLALSSKRKSERKLFSGVSVGINYFTSLYYTCKYCGRYDAYAQTVDSSLQETPGINLTAYLSRNLSRKFFYEATLGYSLYRERFRAEGISSINSYHQLNLSASLLYLVYESEKSKFFVGAGGNVHYLLAAHGKTVTIFKTNKVEDLNSFRTFNPLLGGVHVTAHWLRQVNDTWFLLVHPEVAFEITSFTSYQEYYLQNRFLYALNFGLLKKI